VDRNLKDSGLNVRPGHNVGTPCQLPITRVLTAAEAIGELVYGSARTMSYDAMIRRLGSNISAQMQPAMNALDEDAARRKHIMHLVAAYLAVNPNGAIRIGKETPRGGRRHGGLRRWGSTFYIKLGTTRHYFPGLTAYMRRGDVILADGSHIYVRCRCRGEGTRPPYTTLWSTNA
jgi:hypothetical protein